MRFGVPEAGHRWELVIRSVEFVRKSSGNEILGLVVKNENPKYLPGLGVGWTCELLEQ
jgi:hypothetical protein